MHYSISFLIHSTNFRTLANTVYLCFASHLWDPQLTAPSKTCLKTWQNYGFIIWARTFSNLWLKWAKTMKMKQNQQFFHGPYSSLTPCLSLLRNIKVLQWLSKSKFLSFMTKVSLNNGKETKRGIFSWVIFKPDTMSFFLLHLISFHKC